MPWTHPSVITTLSTIKRRVSGNITSFLACTVYHPTLFINKTYIKGMTNCMKEKSHGWLCTPFLLLLWAEKAYTNLHEISSPYNFFRVFNSLQLFAILYPFNTWIIVFLSPNYWLTAENVENFMSVDLGCYVEILGFKMKNTHNSIENDFSTKKLKVSLIEWIFLTDNLLLETELPNSLNQVNLKLKIIALFWTSTSNAMLNWRNMLWLIKTSW